MFENDFMVEFNDEELGECRTYPRNFKGYEQAIKDLKLYKAKQNQRIAELEAKLAESEKNFIVANKLRMNSDEVLLNYKTEKYGLDKTIQELRKIKLSFPEKEWYYKGFENCEMQMSSNIADLTLEVKELKQQLRDLPKKIVEEIKENNTYLNSSKPNQKDHIYDSYLIEAKSLNAILKKYGGEDE